MSKLNNLTIPALIDRHIVTETTARRDRYQTLRRWICKRTLARRSLERIPTILNGEGFEIPKERGYLIKEPGLFPEVEEITKKTLQVVKNLGLDKKRKWDRSKKQQKWARILPDDEKTLDSAFLQFALRRDIVSAISSYLGVVPLLRNIDVFYSPPGKPSDPIQSSQFYHCDWDADSQIKIFVYASDVNSEAGPLTVLDAKFSNECRKRLNYRWGPGRRWLKDKKGEEKGRVTDAQIESLGGKDRKYPIVGPSRSVAFVDTSRCFHYGSRVKEESDPRIAIMYQFVRPEAFVMPLDFKTGAPFRHLVTPDIPEWQRLVLGSE